MPTRAAASTVMQTMEVQEPEGALSGLQFNEPLSWRAGKPIPIADLLRRLQALSKEMREMEQEETERDSLTTVAKELASPNLLGHKDKSVKAWTACCLVEILKLCAPDAPYTGQQLKVCAEELCVVESFRADECIGNFQPPDHLYPSCLVRSYTCL